MGIFKKDKKSDVPVNYNKLADNFFINYDEKKIIVDNNTFDFANILDVKLVEDGMEKMIGTRVSNGNFGVGVTKVLINKLNIEIKTNDITRPFFSIPFLNLGIRTGFEKSSKKYQEAYQQAQKCMSILEMIVNNNIQVK